ncbi:hypothetical protein BV25DRAFT_1832203 [Artomyces pyxidatus]|uniref:Uncharacterized protein n=1 Tax=Artomyces pyxidatus TaxID=48021 RepID=A0ACB8SJM0_9AGAM|nr:hypothetical protein BV25DRAFT_1832203 [Artomyces pyxidatus]
MLNLQQINALEPGFDIESRVSVQTYAERLSSFRLASYDHPLTQGTSFVVQLDSPVVQDQAGKRSLPSFSISPLPLVLVLESPLQTDKRCLTQVWVARVEGKIGNRTQERVQHVVVKFIQHSMISIPDPDYAEEYIDPAVLALREDAVYRTLHSVQGSAIPYYFGMHVVNLPNQEQAHMLVLEHIEGSTVREWRDSIVVFDPAIGDYSVKPSIHASIVPILQHLLVLSLQSIKAIHDLDIIHADINGKNMILYPSAAAPTQVVFIDFIHSTTPAEAILKEFERLDCCTALVCCEEHSYTIENWAKDNLPDGLVPPIYPDLRKCNLR